MLKTFQFSEDDGGDVFDRDPYGILIRSTMYRGRVETLDVNSY